MCDRRVKTTPSRLRSGLHDFICRVRWHDRGMCTGGVTYVMPAPLRERDSIKGVELMSPVRIDDKNTTTIAPARVVREDALLIFGLGQRYRTNAGIPAQWDRFV